MGKPWFLVHIPKTGGTVFGNHVREQLSYCRYSYPKEYIENKEEVDTSNYEVYGGHVPYSASKLVDKKFRYITILRNPYERCISHWKEITRHERFGNPTLMEFLNAPEFYGLTTNYMTKYIMLHPDWSTITGATSWEHHNQFEQTPLVGSVSVLVDGIACLATLRSFAFVGIKEYMTESLNAVSELVGIKPTSIKTYNRNYDEYLTDEVFNILYERNPVDLYVYGVMRYEFERKYNVR